MLSIGQMSKACGVTVKTLRHYEKIGLLCPCTVEESTGYRYYSEEQIPTMLLISRFKHYGFPLSEIQTLLEFSDPREIHRHLKFQTLRLERKRQELTAAIQAMEHHLRELERTGDIMSYQNKYQITLAKNPPLALLTSRQVMSTEEFGTYYSRLYQRIINEHLTASGLTMAFYHDEEFDPQGSDIEIGVEILEADKADRIIQPTLCATAVHCGPYSTLSEAYGKITEWICTSGYQIAGAPFEIYRKTAFQQLPPDEWETEIFFPIVEQTNP